MVLIDLNTLVQFIQKKVDTKMPLKRNQIAFTLEPFLNFYISTVVVFYNFNLPSIPL